MGKPKRATYHHGDLRVALLDAAEALVAKHGPAGFSLREAARTIGVDPAACYRHFRDREAVLQALAQRGFTQLAARLADVVAKAKRETARDVVAELGRAYVEYAVSSPPTFRVMFGPTGLDARDPRLRGDYPDGVGPYERVQLAIEAWAVADKLGLDIESATLTLWSGVHGLACLLVDGAVRVNNPGQRRRMVDALLETMLVGLEQKAGARRRSRG